MGTAFYIALDSEDPGFDTFVNGKAVAHAVEELDTICRKEGLATLSDFMGQSMSEFADVLGEDIDLPEGEGEEGGEIWFEPDAGIELIDALVAKIRANPLALGSPEQLLEDLADYRRVLMQAKSIGAKWHLALDV